MGLTEKLNEIKSEADALLSYANQTTGQADVNLGEAIRTLSEGYGVGGTGDAMAKNWNFVKEASWTQVDDTDVKNVFYFTFDGTEYDEYILLYKFKAKGTDTFSAGFGRNAMSADFQVSGIKAPNTSNLWIYGNVMVKKDGTLEYDGKSVPLTSLVSTWTYNASTSEPATGKFIGIGGYSSTTTSRTIVASYSTSTSNKMFVETSYAGIFANGTDRISSAKLQLFGR